MPAARAVGAEADLPACPAGEGALAPRIASLAPLAIRNRTPVLAATFIFWRVWGLNCVRAARFRLVSLPKPGSVNSPSFLTAL